MKTPLKSILKIAKLLIIAFLLHLIWENAQAPLYVGYGYFSQHFPLCLVSTIGDVVITLAVLVFIRLLKKDTPQTAFDFLALAIIGFIVAIIIEQNALLAGKWSYTSVMPIITFLKVGLTPVLQMTLLLPLSFYLARAIKIP